MYGDSTNILIMAIWGPTAKFNSCQYILSERMHDLIITAFEDCTSTAQGISTVLNHRYTLSAYKYKHL